MTTLSTLMDTTPLVGPFLTVLQSDPGAALTAARRFSHMSRRWGLAGPVAVALALALAALAYGEGPQ